MNRGTLLNGLGLGSTLVACAGLLFASAHAGHRRTPHPAGMVLRVEAPEAGSGPGFLDVFFVVEVASLEPPAIAVLHRERGGWNRSVYAYPSGDFVQSEHVDAIASTKVDQACKFDFDADGVEDKIECGYREDCGRVRVLSGANGSVLFEDFDDIEYEDCDRAFALGDLDHDGYAELALVHPRQDRSTYDIELWDWLLGAHSWVTVVSGARAGGR